MEETDRGKQARQERPAWVDEPPPGRDDPGRPRRERLPRQPVPGRHEDDGLWEHAVEIGGIVTVATWLAAAFIPHTVPWQQLSFLAAVVTGVTGWASLSLTGSGSVALYLAAWGTGLTAWLTAARIASPYREILIFFLLLLAGVLIVAGVPVIRRHRDRVQKKTEIGRDTANIRECQYWDGLLQRLGLAGVAVRDVIRMDGGYQVHCRLGKITDGRRSSGIEAVREVAAVIAQHKRLPKGAVYIDEEPEGASGGSADFVIHVRSVTGPRLARYLPADNGLLSVNGKFALGVHDTGREFRLKLREVVVFICGLRGSGKSTLLNVFIAQLCRMPDALVCMIDLKGGQEARAWLMPWLRGWTDRPAIDWLATNREEADVMLDALKRAGAARSESGKYGRKLIPGIQRTGEMAAAFVVICDETTVMTGHFIREDGLSNTKLATKLLQIAETFRSVAIDPVVSSVRAVVDNTGNSGFKAMSDVRIGMRVSTADEGRMIFPDNLAAARQLAQLKDKGMGIPKIGAELFPPVHFYNITDGEPDDDGHPTEDRITPVVLATADRCPAPEQFVREAMGEAYEKRWEQPHIAGLMQKWLEEAGSSLPPDPAEQPAGGTGDPFDDIVQHSLSDLDMTVAGEDGESGRRLHPAYKRMRQLLIQRGREGYQAGKLWDQLCGEGQNVARETVSRWLAADEKRGYVFRTGKPRSKWIWRLAPGDEFDIAGMD